MINFRLILLAFCLLISCKKETNLDYRTRYTGNFKFTVIGEHWKMGQPIQYDTLVYDGIVNIYAEGDNINDLSPADYKANNNQRLTIRFLDYCIITPEITKNGEFIEISDYHYHHSGSYINNNEIEFTVDKLGGLGGGTNYTIKGKRK